MNILLIGATGQIGYALAHALAKTDNQTTVLVRSRKLTFPDNVRVIEAGVFSAEIFQSALSNIDTVIYGVGLPEQFAASNDLFRRVNHDIFQTFLAAVEQSAISRLVYISTYEVFEEAIDGIATGFAQRTGLPMTTIHPAAVYGGLNTSYGVTNYLENLLNWRIWNVPIIIPTNFPVVHADSLAKAIIRSIDYPQAFIVSEQMTSLRKLARTLKQHTSAHRPPVVQLVIAGNSIKLMDAAARRLGFRPIMSDSQVKFMIMGNEPKSERVQEMLGWQPMSLDEGIQQYLQDRERLLG